MTMEKLKCPDCGHPQYCPCAACMKNFPPPKGIKPWRYYEHTITCGGCGVTYGEEKWMQFEYELYVRMEKENAKAQLQAIQDSDKSK